MTSIPTPIRAIVIAGPTGSGKSALGIELGEQHAGEIISADSVSVYRGFDIGSSKPSPAELARIPHHLVSVLEPDEEFNAARFSHAAGMLIREIHSRGKLPIVVGGTGLYLRALIEGLSPVPEDELSVGEADEIWREIDRIELESENALSTKLSELDPKTAERLHPNDRFRIRRALFVQLATGEPLSRLHGSPIPPVQELQVLVLLLTPPREKLYPLLDQRVDQMIAQGLLDEVQKLLQIAPGAKALGSIGYRHMAQFLRNEIQYDEMLGQLKRDTRRYAKRQFTWWAHQPHALGWERGEECGENRMKEEIAHFLAHGIHSRARVIAVSKA